MDAYKHPPTQLVLLAIPCSKMGCMHACSQQEKHLGLHMLKSLRVTAKIVSATCSQTSRSEKLGYS